MNRFALCLIVSWLLAGCDGNPAPDGGAAADGGAIDAATPAWPALMAHPQTGPEAPDLSCLGTRTAPPPGDVEAIAAPVVPFGAPPSVTLPGVPVFFHLDGPASAACEPPGCVAVMADAEGIATAELARDAWVTTEVPAIDGPDAMRSFMRTLEAHWSAGNEQTVNTFNRGTLAGFEAVLGAPVDPSTGIVSGRVLDCAERPLSNARLRWFDADGAPVTAGRDVFFDGMVPPGLAPAADATATDGRYAGVDIPPTATRVEAWGSVGDGPPERIACEAIQVEPDTLTVLVLQPTRADGPSSCGAP